MFNVVILEGLFYLSGSGFLMVEKADGEKELVCPHLEDMVGSTVKIAIHHMPPLPPDPVKWGGGCCHWQPAPCPALHHLRPADLLSMSAEGVLRSVGASPNGDANAFEVGPEPLPLDQIVGHDARIAAVALPDLSEHPPDLTEIGDQARRLQEILGQFKNHLGKVDS